MLSGAVAAGILSIYFPLALPAQVTLADYQRAAVFQNARALVSRTSLNPRWIAGSDRFWYLDEHFKVKSFLRVDPGQGTEKAAFDHAKLAAALSVAANKAYTAAELPFDEFEYLDGESAIGFEVDGVSWRCGLVEYVCASVNLAFGAKDGEVLSPDGRRAVFIRDYDLWLRDIATGAEVALTQDGERGYGYGDTAVSDQLLGVAPVPSVYFSADSKRLLAYRIDARAEQELALIQSVPAGRPRLHSYHYPIAGDRSIGRAEAILFDLESKAAQPLRYPSVQHLTDKDVAGFWNESGTQVGFLEYERGYKSLKLLIADARTGEVKPALEERSATYVNRGTQVRLIGEQRQVIWSSERDGWNHLYRIDGRTGAVINQITRGEWVVREVLHVDEKRRQVYFTAGGKEAGEDPYYRHLYRVRWDGTGLELLTPEHADHEVAISPSGRYFVDTYSRIDLASVSVLRAENGRLIRELRKADIAPLVAKGWKLPETFKMKAHDGETDLYGAIFYPSNFDSRKAYPVLDGIYPGPQHIRTVKSFDVEQWESDQALAELGFIVVTVDGMGTPLRSRAFRDLSYGNMGNAGGLEDHVATLKQLAARKPYMDLTRVGIYGHSGGGYASARALLMFPDFYKVAVSSAGNHDQRSYWAEWGERFHGYPVGDNYRSQSNASLVANLKGRLLLVHGDMDDNVHPALTLQLVDALIAANKDFDLLILPNRNHELVDLAAGKAASRRVDPYFLRRRWDYFVRHLMGAEPPTEFKLETP